MDVLWNNRDRARDDEELVVLETEKHRNRDHPALGAQIAGNLDRMLGCRFCRGAHLVDQVRDTGPKRAKISFRFHCSPLSGWKIDRNLQVVLTPNSQWCAS